VDLVLTAEYENAWSHAAYLKVITMRFTKPSYILIRSNKMQQYAGTE